MFCEALSFKCVLLTCKGAGALAKPDSAIRYSEIKEKKYVVTARDELPSAVQNKFSIH